jgi:hypothetical protein
MIINNILSTNIKHLNLCGTNDVNILAVGFKANNNLKISASSNIQHVLVNVQIFFTS